MKPSSLRVAASSRLRPSPPILRRFATDWRSSTTRHERGARLPRHALRSHRPLLPRPRRPERTLPLIDAAPTWTPRYWPMWATHVPLSLTSGLVAARVGRGRGNDMRAHAYSRSISSSFCPSLVALLSTTSSPTSSMSLCSGICQEI